MKFAPFTLLVFFTGIALLQGCSETVATPPPTAIPLEPTAAPVATKPLDPYLQNFLNEYEQYFADSLLLSGTPGAALVIVKDSQVVFIKGYGEKAIGSGDPINAHTRFRIGSLSKGFAGVLTGMMVAKGFLKWDDPVQQHFPDFHLKDEKQARRVQVRHLLSHTDGLPYHAFDNLVEQGYDRETIVSQYFPNAKLFGQEGRFFGYQNVSFSLIEPVLEAATRQSYRALLQEFIFYPAGMYDTSLDFSTMQNTANKALPHSWQASGWAADSISTFYYDFAAAGGINASISDMGEWLKVLLGHRPDLISSETLDDVFQPFIATGLERRTLPGWIDRDSAYYAMGWRILKTSSGDLIYHAGFVNNFHSEIALDRRDGIGVCVLFNANSPLRGKCIRAFFERWENMLDEKECEKAATNRQKISS
ncbi:MAG: serine hydrolase domain-containing protein [Saprospiraceae bacterium]